MEANLKKVLADLNRNRGSSGGGSAGGLQDVTANPIAKVGSVVQCSSVYAYQGGIQYVLKGHTLCMQYALFHPSSTDVIIIYLRGVQIVAVLNNHHDSLAWLDEKSR